MRKKKYAVFTMDVEAFSDTECLRSAGIQPGVDLMDGFDEYIRIMDRHGIKNTLFTLGELAPRIADRLRQCVSNGHALALHGQSHDAPMTLSLEQFRERTRMAKKNLLELFGVDVVGFRAPCFSMDADRLDVLQELDFRYDSSYLDFSPARHTVKLDMTGYERLRRNIFRRDQFYEFGLSKGKILGNPFPVSGGGYVRLFPWAFMRHVLRQYIRENDYYVFYLHPFELTRQKVPHIKNLTRRDRYYIRRGIRTYGWRIEGLIRMLKRQGYEFVTFEQLVQIMGTEHPATN